MTKFPIDDFLHMQRQVPLYWLADDWGRWATEEEFVREFKWALLWNDIVFIPDDFILTNRFLRGVLDPTFTESNSIAELFRLGVLRIVVRDKHTGYSGEISSFFDAAKAIDSDPNFVWPRSEPSETFVEHIHTASLSHIARPIGINVDEKFRQKMMLLTGQDGPSIANEYYSSLFHSEGGAHQRTNIALGELFSLLQELIELPRIRRSLLYKLADFPSLTPSEQDELKHYRLLSLFPKTLRSIGDDVFLHNLMENFLPIATFPEGHPTPIWFDTTTKLDGTDGILLHNVVTHHQILPTFTGKILSRLHTLSFTQVRTLRQRSSGINYRRVVAELLLQGIGSDKKLVDELFQSCSGFIVDIAKEMGVVTSASPLDRYILKWKIFTPTNSLRCMSLGLIVQSLQQSSRILPLFSTTITEKLANTIDEDLLQELVKAEVIAIANKSQRSHQHLT